MKIIINEKEISVSKIQEWEKKRSVKVANYLYSKFNIPKINCNQDIVSIRNDLADIKLKIGEDALRSSLKNKLIISSKAVKLLNVLCLNKRKSSIIEIRIKDCDAKKMIDKYFDLMLNNTDKNLRNGIIANPDHYIIKGYDKNIQEVIETTGGCPIPSHFFIHYGIEKGLCSKSDSKYPYQAAGVCCLKDGTPIGGVRHQMRNEGSDFHVKLEVEFPKLLPKYMINQHQLHLACEFYNWFSELKK